MKVKDRRKSVLGGALSRRLKFINFVMLAVVLFAFLNAYASIDMLGERALLLKGEIAYYTLQFTFVTIGLIFIATLCYLMHHGFGAIARMEDIIEKILGGDRSLRINLRKKDILRPFAEEVNKLIDVLEKDPKK